MGSSYLSKPATKKTSRDEEAANWRCGVSSMQGWRVNMEDADRVVRDMGDGTSYFGVFDGHCGKEVALYVSKYLHQYIRSLPSYTASLHEAVINGYLNVDQSLLTPKGQRELKFLKCNPTSQASAATSDSDSSDDECKPLKAQHYFHGMNVGSTGVTALVRDDLLVVAHVGDSRCVLCRGGIAIAMTSDHKPWMEGEMDRIRKAGGKVCGNRLYGRGPLNLDVSRTFGDHSLKQNGLLGSEDQIVSVMPDVRQEVLTREDEFLVLACDGIWDQMTNQQCVDFIRDRLLEDPATRLSSICEELMDCCLSPESPQHGAAGCDNMTIMLVQLTTGKREGGAC
ncbi:uncharacterized protein LOC134183424 [Corticium candelabrum]|uniref:uncharacterized protein LOC134183424 n=1 Tax=Corticium candelabrum TaxID=121492 RepID=UPI002E276A28|nr:uncharacterized protein LOC134183424 [Corticium candelabrum]